MEDSRSFPVYFECLALLPRHEIKVQRYFLNHRKSGGGECGKLRKVTEGGYSISFQHEKDQREVLRRARHVVEFGDTRLELTVTEEPQTNTSPQGGAEGAAPDSTATKKSLCNPGPSRPPSGDEHELQLDSYLIRFLKDCPKAGKWLDKQLDLLDSSAELNPDKDEVLVKRNARHAATNVGNWKTEVDALIEMIQSHYICRFVLDPQRIQSLLESGGAETADDVRVYREVGMAVVVGESTQVNARLSALQDLQNKPLKQRIVWPLGEAKLRLLWQKLERSLQRDFPEVKATQEEGGRLILEGVPEEVHKADEFVSEWDRIVVETTLSDVSPRLLGFLKKAYSLPGMLSDFAGSGVEIEVRERDLRLFSFSTASLAEAELALQREFKLTQIKVPNFTDQIFLYLSESLKPMLKAMNSSSRRAEAFVGSDKMVYIVGHSREVKELKEVVSRLILDQSCEERLENLPPESLNLSHSINISEPSLLPSTSSCRLENSSKAAQKPSALRSEEDVEVVARYVLSDELEVLVCSGDITKQEADALVNAANEDLRHGGGVALALSEAGGPEVQRESSNLVKNVGKIRTGDVVMTTGGRLKCKALLHAVGPEKHKAGGRESVLIKKAITSALNLCEIMDFGSIALPCISSGVFGVPTDVCAEAIVSAVRAFGAAGGRSLNRITLIDNRREVVQAMRAACDRLLQDTTGFSGTFSDEAGGSESETEEAAGGSGVRVEIIQGTIESQQVDAVVSPMIDGDPRSTRVGNSLCEAAGRQLMDIFRKQDGGKIPGDVVLVRDLTGAPFKAAFFVHLIRWDNDPNGTAIQVLRLAVSNVLTSCEIEGFSSLALPILGAGMLFGFPEDVVGQVLHEEIQSFDQKRSNTNPFRVHVVCYHSDPTFEKTFSSIQEPSEHPVSQESDTKRIVLLGKTGSGKSSLGNIILGEEVFQPDHTPNSGTGKCQAETRTVNGRNITLIDTPGFFDSGRPEEELKPEILDCVIHCAPGPHAFLIVLKVEKFTEQEQAAIMKILQYFSEEALQYATVVFTHGNQLPPNATIETFVSKSEGLRELVRKCGNRCHVFDNIYWNDDQKNQYRSNQFQVEELLKSIDKTIENNKWGFYTNKVLTAVKKEIEIEEDKIKETATDMTPQEIQKEAKRRVSNRFLISLAGIATGTVLGAYVGVEALVRMVLTAVQNPSVVKNAQKATSAVGFKATGRTGLVVGAFGVGVAAVAGGVMGGVLGGQAADGAESMQEAVDRAKKGIMEVRAAIMP